MSAEPVARPVGSIRRWVRSRFTTAPAIYGLVVYAVAVASSSSELEEDAPRLKTIAEQREDTADVLFFSVFALLIFFTVHAFAETLARHGSEGFRAALRKAIDHSSGMLFAAILPTLLLLVWVIAGWRAEDSGFAALLTAVGVLGLLGFEAFRARGARWWACLLGALATAAFGGVVIVLDLLVH